MPRMLVVLDPEKKPTKPKRPKGLNKPAAEAERLFRRRMSELYKTVLQPANDKIRDMIRQKQPTEVIAGEIERALEQARLRYKMEADQFLTEWQLSVSTISRERMQEALKHMTGLDIQALVDSIGIEDALKMATMEAAGLIKSIPEQHLGKVAKAVYDNFIGNPLPEDRSLLKQLQVLGVQSHKRAKNIARDQTKKLTSTLSQARQQGLGVKMYIWRTSKDERVVGNLAGIYPVGNKAHGDHFHMADMYCRWDDPSVYSDDKGVTWKKRTTRMPNNHPGQDIMCRCYAEPVIDLKKLLADAVAA